MELFLGLAIILSIVSIIIIYNGIIRRFNSVEEAWSNVISLERQMNKILPELEKLVNQYQDYESGVMTQITELRSALDKLSSNKVDTKSLETAHTKSAQMMKGINALVENYPELKASESYTQLMREITEQNENIGAGLRIFNGNAKDFNDGIQEFPNSLVNGLLNKKEKLAPFSDSEAESGFEYKPNF